jgi:hypothetical protein
MIKQWAKKYNECESHGLWGAVLVFLAIRGLAQAIWYPRLERKIA